MAGKVNKGKSKGKTVNSEPATSTEAESTLLGSLRTTSDAPAVTKASNSDADGNEDLSSKPLALDGGAADKVDDANPTQTATKQEVEGEIISLFCCLWIHIFVAEKLLFEVAILLDVFCLR